MSTLTILIHCSDQQGIIATTTDCIHQHSGNVVYIDQHVDRLQSVFFMRLECEFDKENNIKDFEKAFRLGPAKQFNMSAQIHSSLYKPKMAVFVSKYDHCLYDILSRYHSGEWAVEIPFIVSNHIDLAHIAKAFDVPFIHIPVTKETKKQASEEQLKLLKNNQIDFMVLARYMQIIDPAIIEAYPNAIINIHHSFLPAFPGAKPYHSAYERGVKIIGATSHYVTDELDGGPIIEQAVSRVSHSHSIDDLIAEGRDLEKIVFAKAIKNHLNRKVMVYNNKTVIFS